MKNRTDKIVDGAGHSKAKEREQDNQISRMKKYPPSLNGINKNLP
ncbi:hypothetical protein [Cohnella abietis]|uniref:Uncharacterized protein n=1 Tax=Cohnella abietis TaxID=2507935 RepID=A0A3T1D6K4_9BACL|nr:hypothetical protein [Cohnella abietis]BBI33694.1 hypothetical protein KCTCHS21_30930 [Cohnella abietis]